MVYQAVYSGLGGLNAQGKKIEVIADNIANLNTDGFKRREAIFTNLVTQSGGSGNFSSGGVLAKVISQVGLSGTLRSTNSATDVAINGSGMFVVNTAVDGTGSYGLTRAGKFTADAKGFLVNSAGQYLMAWPLDNEGRLPGEVGNINGTPNTLLNSLEAVNLRNISGAASSTTKIDVAVTLDARVSQIEGSGQTISFPEANSSDSENNKAKRGTDTGLILPSDTSTGNIQFGDKLVLYPTPPGTEYTFTLGGITSSGDITGGILGASTAEATFVSASNNQSFKITINGKEYTYTIKKESPNTSQKQFNSLETLATAINDGVNGLSARISNDRLYIGPIDGVSAVTFTDVNGTIATALGFTDIDEGSDRFSTVQSLITQINSKNGLKAFTDGKGGIKFYTQQPTGSLKIHGIKNVDTTIETGDAAVTNATTANKRAITIASTAHGLSDGDLVSVAGLTGDNGATLADGTYMVKVVDANNFKVFSSTDATAVGDASSTDFTWKRAPGYKETANNVGVVEAELTAANNLRLTVTTHGYAVGDVVFIEGYHTGGAGISTEEVPDGYYVIQAVSDGDHFDITPATDGAGVVAAANVAGSNFTVRKVGVDGTPYHSAAISTTNASSTVRVSMPNHGFSVGEGFTFKNVGTEGSYNGITFDNSTTHIITDKGTDWIEFEAVTSATATGVITDTSLESVTVNNYSALFDEMGLDYDEAYMGPAYDSRGGDYGDNLSAGNIKSKSIFQRATQIYDSLGVAHNFKITFGKLDDNLWAVEVSAAENEDGSYDIINPGDGGQVAAGTVQFNGDGTLATVSSTLANAVSINWVNQAQESSITFNWGTAGAPKGTAGATQYGEGDGLYQVASGFSERLIEPNGFEPGEVESIRFLSDGSIEARFSNGSAKSLYRTPLASAANPDGFMEKSGGVYQDSTESGPINLRRPGQDGVGLIQGSALEQSNVDLSNELTQMIVGQKSYQANSKIIKVVSELLDNIDRNLG